ncbi:MAG TPA: nicotinate (nicotinamide) nucleotide adenylyltransferase [Planctomycetes bacterium]|nr:nicotinate (nicotinamide) nucleotide adenylyltransferase [Planctomycetota bacterium]
MKTIVFGGSFDPLHNGHIAVADAVQANLTVDEFLWTPSWHAVHKLDIQPASADFRVRCLEEVLLSRPQNERLCSLEVDSQRPCFSVDTLEQLARQDSSRELSFLVGGDSLSHLNTWHDLPRLFATCNFLLVPRPQWGVLQLNSYIEALPDALRKIFRAQFVDMSVVDISSSDIRQRLAAGADVLDMPDVVRGLIAAEKVYS